MSDDLVESLRALTEGDGHDPIGGGGQAVCAEAANEIERLRAERDAALAELAAAREHLPIGYAGSLVDAIEEFMEQANTAMDLRDAALARIARLEAERAALRQAVSFFASVIKSGEPWAETCIQRRLECGRVAA